MTIFPSTSASVLNRDAPQGITRFLLLQHFVFFLPCLCTRETCVRGLYFHIVGGVNVVVCVCLFEKYTFVCVMRVPCNSVFIVVLCC